MLKQFLVWLLDFGVDSLNFMTIHKTKHHLFLKIRCVILQYYLFISIPHTQNYEF
jgi:hypothetical protein